MKQEELVKERVGNVGGQAVLEGVMMRGKTGYTTAVRKPDGSIVRDSHPNEIQKNIWGKVPVVRGVVNFIASMRLAYSTLAFAAEASGLDEGEPESRFEKWLDRVFGKKLTAVVMGIGMVLGVALGVGLFILLPGWISGFIPKELYVLRRVTEGALRVIIFVSYILLISLMKDIKRTFMYHGAEHKSIACYERGLDLTVENVKKQCRFHPRCGTSFMFLMIFVGILIGILLGFIPGVAAHNWLYMAIKLLLLPLTMGLGYEIIRYAGKHNNLFIRIVTAPGLWIQRLTTKEPEDDMMEVAIVALKSALPDEFSEEDVFAGIDPSPKKAENAEETAEEGPERKPEEDAEVPSEKTEEQPEEESEEKSEEESEEKSGEDTAL